MNSAQRAALNGLMRIGGQMSNVCFNLSQYQLDDPNMTTARWAHTRETLHDLWQQWDAARNRYFELEAEAKQSRTAQQMVRKDLEGRPIETRQRENYGKQ